MRRHILAAVLAISTSSLSRPMIHTIGQAAAAETMPSTLDSLRERYRPLLVFAPTDRDARFVKQAQRFASGSVPLRDRQVLFVPVSYESETESLGVLDRSQMAEFSREEKAKARLRFHVGPDEFTVILVGKDGGEKLRAHTPVTIERLNAVIDAMPMRQQEVRNGNSK